MKARSPQAPHLLLESSKLATPAYKQSTPHSSRPYSSLQNFLSNLLREALINFSFCRHCEERSDEAISKYMIYLKTRLLISPHPWGSTLRAFSLTLEVQFLLSCKNCRYARNDELFCFEF